MPFLLSREFLQLGIGGPLTGLAFGMVTAFWLRYMYNVPTAEITLTIVATYGTYIVGDSLFHVSAVLAVVTLGALCPLNCCSRQHMARGPWSKSSGNL